MSDKTEQPTPRRLKDARKQGQIPRSRLLSGAVVTFAALAAIAVTGPSSAQRLRALAVRAFSAGEVLPSAMLQDAVLVLAACALPVLVAALLASAAISVAFAGFEFHPDQLKPKLERLNVLAGLKRLASWKQVLETGKALVVALIVGWIVWSGLRDGADELSRGLRLEGDGAFRVLWSVLAPTVMKAALVLLALGGADYLLARRRHLLDLRMSREEVKQEHKNSEGDPQQKGKRKALHRELSRGGPARGVQSATAIVVNPTHIAVALRYVPDECEAPYIVAKGREEDAFAIRREAQAAGIPVVRDIPLARSLIHYDVGEEVPEELYRAAAAVLKVAMESRDADIGPRSQTS